MSRLQLTLALLSLSLSLSLSPVALHTAAADEPPPAARPDAPPSIVAPAAMPEAAAAPVAAPAPATASSGTSAAPAEAPAPAAQKSEMSAETMAKMKEAYEGFRTMKERLPFSIGAGVYLFYYQPLDRGSTLAGGNPTCLTDCTAGSLDGSLQVYAFYLKLDKEFDSFGGHAEIRMRDGGHVGAGANNAYLRGFFTSNLWFQEVYAYYKPGAWLQAKVGKVYRKVGIFWDDSFFGNVHYFDGLKLNPDYGVSLEGNQDLGAGKLNVAYSAQFFLNSDGVQGGLDYARTVGDRSTTVGLRQFSPDPEGETDASGNRIGAIRNIVDGRVVATVKASDRINVAIGVSALTGTVRRNFGGKVDDGSMTHIAADASLTAGPVIVYGEYLNQSGEGVRSADYILAGARATFGPVALRLNASFADYHLKADPSNGATKDFDVQEYILQPGVTWAIGGGLAALVEYDEWQRKDPHLALAKVNPGVGDYTTYDRSLNVVFAYSY